MPVVITLLTDFGTRDSYVGELRGVLLIRAPGAVLADIGHDIPPGDIRSAAYVLGRCRDAFPPGTVHLAVVDPGVGSPRAALALRSEGRYFVGPDNGLFTPVLDAAETVVRLVVGGTSLRRPLRHSPPARHWTSWARIRSRRRCGYPRRGSSAGGE